MKGKLLISFVFLLAAVLLGSYMVLADAAIDLPQ